MAFVGKDTLLLGDCFIWDDGDFVNYHISDVILRGEITTVKQSSETHRNYEWPHRNYNRGTSLQSTALRIFGGGNNTIRRLVNLHDDPSAAFSVAFTVDAWNRLASRYNDSFFGWVRRLLRMTPKGRNRAHVARIELPANRDNSAAWRFPETFDMVIVTDFDKE